MFYTVCTLKDLINLDGEKFQRKTILENIENSSSIQLVALKKNELIDTHTSNQHTLALVLEGEIELHFTAEKFTLEKGQYLIFEKDKEHKVFALKDSKFMLIKL